MATMPLQTSLSSDNFKKCKPLLCPPVAELQRLSRNVIRCLPLSRLPSTLPVKDKNSKPLRIHTCPKNSICLFLIVFNSQHLLPISDRAPPCHVSATVTYLFSFHYQHSIFDTNPSPFPFTHTAFSPHLSFPLYLPPTEQQRRVIS